MVKRRQGFILCHIVILSGTLLAVMTFWLGSQVHYQVLQKQEYQYWQNKYQAVRYVRQTKNLVVDKKAQQIPRIVYITKTHYALKVTPQQIVMVPKK